jgi:UDP-N-acetylglucosamine acyltransferase
VTAHVHPTAIIAPTVTLQDNVSIGAYCVVDGNTTIKAGTRLLSHVVVSGNTTIGENCTVYPFATIGLPPQDLKYGGEASRVEIGANTVIREHVTVHAGTQGGGLLTRVGAGCLLMVGVHIAHDCQVGDGVILANNATLAGHVTVGDNVVIGGLAAVHQFVRIGKHAMIGGLSGVEHDVLPFATVMGERAHLAGLNIVGLKRRGFSREDIHALRRAVRDLFREDSTVAIETEKLAASPSGAVQDLVGFIRSASSRQLCRPVAGGLAAGADAEAA